MTDIAADIAPILEPLTPALITTWALDPPNRARAIAFGRQLITAKDADALRNAESLGAFEDRATAWAIDHTMRAKMLVLQLLAKLKPTPEEITGTPENTDDSDSHDESTSEIRENTDKT
jgi:hypothetical protein